MFKLTFTAPRFFLVVALLPVASFQCSRVQSTLSLELQASFNRFAQAVRHPSEDNLRKTVFIPDTTDYKEYATSVLTQYLQDVQGGTVTFDPHGLVLCRFLSLDYNRYAVLSVAQNEDGAQATMHLSVNFSFDANIEYNRFEEGTKVFVPGNPWGTAHVITIGGRNEVPRQQLSYIELKANFRRTNVEGHWQVRGLDIVSGSDIYVESFDTH